MRLLFPTSEEPVAIHVIGAGGTGSNMLASLAQLAQVLPALGHPGLDVAVWDDDTVSSSNLGRQAFTSADLGLKKCDVLVNRINLSLGLKWQAVGRKFTRDALQSPYQRHPTVLLAAVDTRAARAEVNGAYNRLNRAVWIDCGNSATTGQCVLGYRSSGRQIAPCAASLFPEIVAVEADGKDNAPSCSVAESLARQDLMVNRMVGDIAIGLLWRMLRFGELEHHGAFVDCKTFTMTPIPVDPAVWAAMGWQTAEKA